MTSPSAARSQAQRHADNRRPRLADLLGAYPRGKRILVAMARAPGSGTSTPRRRWRRGRTRSIRGAPPCCRWTATTTTTCCSSSSAAAPEGAAPSQIWVHAIWSDETCAPPRNLFGPATKSVPSGISPPIEQRLPINPCFTPIGLSGRLITANCGYCAAYTSRSNFP